jgi:hypothetical protein
MMGTMVDAWDHVNIYIYISTPTLKSPIIFSKVSALWNLKGFFLVNVSLPTYFVFLFILFIFSYKFFP